MDEVSRKDAETQRGEERTMGQAICDYSPPGSELWGRLFISLTTRERTMGQAIYITLESFASWRLERSGREKLIGNCFLTRRGKGG